MNLDPLLDLIAKGESGKDGYNAIYSKAVKLVGRHILTSMSLDQIRALQEKMKPSGSTACGRYQFIRTTFDATRLKLGLRGSTVWTADVQDQMATYLLNERGLRDYMAGRMSRENFANNLAREWASLPVVTALKGATRALKPGQSYYAGDGLNAALHKPEAVLAVLDALKSPWALPGPGTTPPYPIPPPPDIDPDTDMPDVGSAPPLKPAWKPTIQETMLGVIAALLAALGVYFIK